MPPYEIPDKIDEQFVQGLVDRNQPENLHYEFKQQLNIRSDRQKQRFLAHASAFANTEGGFLVHGIKQGEGQLKGKATEIHDISCSENDDDLLLKVEDLLLTGISPNIVDLDVEIITMNDANRVLVIHASQSDSMPHMVTHGGINKIYKRRGGRTISPDLDEMKQMFISSELSERALDEKEEYRGERLDSIRNGETFVATIGGPVLVLHIVPNNFGKALRDIDLSKMGPEYSFAFGLVYISDNKSYYVSVSEDCCLEFVCKLVTKADYIGSAPEDKNTINALDIEGALLHLCMSEVFKYFSLLGKGGSLYFMLSLLNVEGVKLELPENSKFDFHSVSFNAYRDPRPIREKDLIVPELLVQDPEPGIEFLQNAWRPAIDRLWRASGWPQSKKLRYHG